VIKVPDITDNTKEMAAYYHEPQIIEAQDIEIARRIASERAKEKWPTTGGWILRGVSIVPIHPESSRRLVQLWQSGLIAQHIERPETGYMVNLDADLQPSTLIETDKPAS
jgi:hypothetical protein